ncbi:retrovirus-related pol polyprotein from transposon TNT 1-94 [Tanacetum coccineum]
MLSIIKMKAASYLDAGLEQMVPDQMWAEEEYMYDISASYGISHWWFKRQQFYIDRHSADTNRRAIVRTHMRILSVVRIEVFSLYEYDYMKKIVLRRADNQEYTIAESDFKDLYPSDFKDLYLLNLQGHLNHLPPKDKKILSTAVNLWIRNLVIRKWVEDFQLSIESYQTQLNLAKPRWEATGLEFMHDYKILDSPRAVVFRDRYGMQMIMHFHEIHKFWTKNDVIKSKQFMFAIQKRLKLRRIFQDLESFVVAILLVRNPFKEVLIMNLPDHRKFKGHDIVENASQVSNATTIAPGLYKIDPVTLAPKNNRETHIYYLKHTMEQATILKEIDEQAKSLNLLDSATYSACKYVKLVQELLGYVRDTCPDIHKPRVSRSTKSNRSKSIDNTKNDRILQISSSTQKKNKHSKLNTNSELVYVKCNISMFDAIHELCFLEFVFDMNASSKSMSIKKAKIKEECKPTGKVFTKIGYNWRPIGRTFTLVRNACPLTRITAINKVPLREPIPLEVVVEESVVTKVYIRRPKVPKTNGSNRKPNIVKSVISNKMKPGTSRGSNTSVSLSSSSLVDPRKPNLSYLHVFGALCYPNNDSEDLGKLQAKADISIFIGYAPKQKAYRIYNRHTQKIIETIHVDFDELTAMASEQISSGPRL